MEAFAYASPRTIAEAVALLEREGAAVLAGGTDLLSLMKDGVVAPKLLVNIKQIAGLDAIEAAGVLRIGATATLARIASHPGLAASHPAIVQAIEGILSPQIRAMGTLGGELCQRPRCWYYRAGFGLLARRDGRSMVEAGDHRYHAIFGDGPARFVSPSTVAPALIALGARIRVYGPRGERFLRLEDFYLSPVAEGDREHLLGPAELVIGVDVPEPDGRRSATYEVRQRHALDWPLAAAAVAFRLDGDRVSRARVVLGHVAPTPILSAAAAQALEAAPLSHESAEAAGRAAVASAKPLPGNAYKVQLAAVAVRRAVLRGAGREA